MTPREMLLQAGLRATPIREGVLVLLLREGRPLSHADLTARSEEIPKCDKVTLYRTLESLTEHGLVHKAQGIDAQWRYCASDPELPGCPGNHPHFLCLSCGAMVCLLGQPLPRIEVPKGVTVLGKQLIVYGICDTCTRTKGKENA
ncbi:transcriptional repressor [Aminiphilus sp.]|uniref:Fur family transcriptional regulator n=1 Tax=Aminiphilus sp. TaxID=1872488 RepID=UPI00261BDD15|nr:transcriptional repressor [Aminiphilus sp.]